MSRPTKWFIAPVLASVLAVGCGGDEAAAPEVVEAQESALSAELLDTTWPVLMATEAGFGPYAAKSGWISLVMQRDVPTAVERLGPDAGPTGARVHTEAAFVYRQAALLAAHALIETYGNTPDPTDPVGTAHLLTVSYALVGEVDKARAQATKLAASGDALTAAWHAPWKAWLDGGAQWPPKLVDLPLELPMPQPGGWPTVTDLPHYRLPEVGADTVREMGDPGALVALALWHDAAAIAASSEHAPAARAVRAGYALPIEAGEASPKDVPMEILFGSDLSVAGDAAFLVDLHGASGTAAVDAHAATSVLAALAVASRGSEGTIDAEKAVDVLAQFREDVLARSASQTNNEVQAHHRQFADIAYVGAFRGLALVAEVEGDREASGLLRINAMEKSEKATACPTGLVALGAWDAANRYPTRAQEILHAHARRFPSLEIARYGLDVMALRVSRERPGETPGM